MARHACLRLPACLQGVLGGDAGPLWGQRRGCRRRLRKRRLRARAAGKPRAQHVHRAPAAPGEQASLDGARSVGVLWLCALMGHTASQLTASTVTAWVAATWWRLRLHEGRSRDTLASAAQHAKLAMALIVHACVHAHSTPSSRLFVLSFIHSSLPRCLWRRRALITCL